jgi:hypothetical protein
MANCFAMDALEDPLAGYRTKGNRHGLYEIREAARDFIRQENAKGKKARWQAGDPDLRVVVWECAAPLTTKWRMRAGPRPSVVVSCPRTLKDAPVKTWEVPVPVAPVE